MKRQELISRVAEYAVSRDRPLHKDLQAVRGKIGAPMPEAEEAIRLAEAGQLMPALYKAGVDSLVAQTALLDPGSAMEVGRMQRTTPGSIMVGLPLFLAQGYLVAALLAQILIAFLLMTRAAVYFREMAHETGGTPYDALANVLQPMSLVLPFIVLVLLMIAGFVYGTQYGRKNFAKWSYWSMRGVKTLRACSIVAKRGVAPARALAVLGSFGGAAANQIQELESAKDLDADALESLADHLYASAQTRVHRVLNALRIVGTSGLVLSALALLLSMYLRLATIALPLVAEGRL